MKKFCTPRNLKLLSYLFVILYCIKISLPISNPIMLIVRLFALTLLFALFFIIDLDIIKKNIYKNTNRSVIVAIVFALASYVMDTEGFAWWLLMGKILLIIQCPLFAIKKDFSIRLIFERCGQFFLLFIIQSICWSLILAIDLMMIHGEMIYDGVEIMFLSVVGFAYFWTVDTFIKPNNN